MNLKRTLFVCLSAGILGALLGLTAAASVDHSEFGDLEGPFESGPEVTEACLGCHNNAAEEVMATAHWQWLGKEVEVPGHKGKIRIGKKNLINNFCIGITPHIKGCTKCHIGYGWEDDGFDFEDETKIDCLVCHDTTDTYVRRAPADEVDLAEIAQNVGKTSIKTCGTCHFRGGSGDGVKHGDLDPSLEEPDRELDVHMGADGLDFTCSTCHRGDEAGHSVRGRSISVSVDDSDRLTCAHCHGKTPHGRDFIFRTDAEKERAGRIADSGGKAPAWKNRLLNRHTRKLACQTCHIPEYAKKHPVKTWWDWSQAGRHDEHGHEVMERDKDRNITYLGSKGSFKWEMNLVPEYRWFDGTSGRYILGDTFDPSKILKINDPIGRPDDPKAKIWPFRVHRGKQIYDTGNKTLIVPYVYGPKGSGAFHADFDWDAAAREGAKATGQPYSGKHGFVETEMSWPLSHMIAPKDEAVRCEDCHSRESRLAGVGGIYIPSKDRSRVLDFLGWMTVVLSLIGAILHSLGRRFGFQGFCGLICPWRKQ